MADSKGLGLTPQSTPVRLPSAGGRSGEWRHVFFGGGGGLVTVQALVPIAANDGKDPEVIDAAACTFLH
jgi:hypothetical protein